MNENQKNYTIIPEGDSRCVWMSAGILSYQLCNRAFDCDACPLDMAMRQHFPRPEGEKDEAAPGREREETELRGAYSYTATHFWVKSISTSLYRVGLEPGIARALFVPRTIVLPASGETLQASQPCLWFVMEAATVPFDAFADGVVVTQNVLLPERPYKVHYHPYDQGWLFDMKFDAAGGEPDLLTAVQAEKLYGRDQKLFRDRLRDTLQTAPAGATLQDGGQLLKNLPEMLGPKKYFDLIEEIFLKRGVTKK